MTLVVGEKYFEVCSDNEVYETHCNSEFTFR